MPHLGQAARSLLKAPGFTLVAVLTIAVGIGATTALFSTFNTLVLHPQSFPQSDRLVRLWASNAGVGLNAPAMSWPRYEFIRDHERSFTSVSVAAFTGYTITREGADPEQANTVAVTASFFPTLGVAPLYGRNFTREDDSVGGPRVVIISYEYWQRAFGGRESAVGEQLTLNGNRFTIVGITPPALSNPYRTVLLYVPRPFEGNGFTLEQVQSGSGYLGATARLKPGITLEQARSEVATLSRDYRAAFPDKLDAKSETAIRIFADELVGNIRPTFYLLLGAVGLVLLIACANVASLFLGRLSARHREIAVRLSLGATRGQLVQQFLAESALFSLVAGAAGLIVASWALAAIERLAVDQLPPGVTLALDARALVFTVGVSVCSGLLVGLLPALHASRANLSEVLNDSARGSSGARSARFRSALIVGEVTLSVVLLVLSCLLLLSFVRLQRAPAGFNAQGVATSLLALPVTRYATDAQQANFYDQLIERLEAASQVKRAAVVVGLPLSGIQPRSPYAVAGRPIPPLRERALASLDIVSDHYFEALRIPLREGRSFEASDAEKSPPVCLINESFATRLFPGESALGKVLLRGPEADIKLEIVGIVGDVRSMGLTAPPPDEIYLRIRQFAQPLTFIVVRTDGDPAALRPLVRSTVIDLDHNQPIALFETLEASLAQALGAQRVTAWLTVAFAAVALLLSALGLYSVLAYAVTQRTSEIGIRMALGAKRQQVVALVLRSGLRLVAVGLVLGLAAAAGAARLIQTLLYYVQPLDPLIYSAVTVLFSFIAILACLLPSLRASRIDPVLALRAE
jgi:putative ABC transport system permease protein